MNIGDVFFGFRGDGARLQKDAQVAGGKAGDTAANSFKKQFSGANIGKGIVQGLGLAGGLGIASAISKITDVLGDSIAAAREDEASQQRLGTALAANIPNWNGQTQAIEKTIAARMKLGFTDEEQRDSLARIVVATKDETKALQVQRVAMDLARLKKISLTEAGDALIKVEGGQFRALKALGIQLPKNATATEALAAVTKAARGQAEDFAKTNEGRLLIAQVKQGEASEKLGYIIMPAYTDAMVAAADAVSSLSTFLTLLNGKTADSIDAQAEATDSAIGLLGALGGLFPGYALIAKGADNARDHTLEMSDRMGDAGRAVEGSMGTIEDASGDMASSIKEDSKTAQEAWTEMRDGIIKDANDLIDDAFDPIITQDRLAANEAEISAQRRIIASKDSTAAEIRDARARITELKKDNADYLVQLAEAGQTNSAAYKNGLAELKAAIKAAKGPAKAALQEILDKILEIERVGKVVPINFRISSKTTSGLGPGGKAAGGPVSAGIPYLVGERGPEIVVPRTASTVLTNAQSRGAIGSMGAAAYYDQTTVNIGRLESNGPSDIAFELRRLAVTKSMLPKPWRPR